MALGGREVGEKREQSRGRIGSAGGGEGFERGVAGGGVFAGGEFGKVFGGRAAEIAEGVEQGRLKAIPPGECQQIGLEVGELEGGDELKRRLG